MNRILPLVVIVTLAIACGTTEQSTLREFPRDAAGFTLLDPTPDGSIELANGISRLVTEGEDGGEIYSYDGRIFCINFSRTHGGGNDVSDIVEKSINRFGEPVYSDPIILRFEDDTTLATLRLAMRNYTISLVDKVLAAEAFAESKLNSLLQIPVGKSVTVDGYMRGNEWYDAMPIGLIPVEEGWDVSVFAKRDDKNLYFVFVNSQLEEERYMCPEVLIDVDGDLKADWESDDFWLHASFNDCEAVGAFNVWESCAPEKPGWQASNFPLVPPGHMEFSISFEKLGITDPSGARIGLALNVTDTQKKWLFWPENAKMESPATWAIVHLE